MIKQHIPSRNDIRRKTAISKILESKGKNKGKSLKEAGYSNNYAINPSEFLNTKKVKKELDWLKYEMEQIQLRMEKTRDKAKYKELGDTYQGFSKIQQLLGGGATERIVITDEERSAVDKAFNNN